MKKGARKLTLKKKNIKKLQRKGKKRKNGLRKEKGGNELVDEEKKR